MLKSGDMIKLAAGYVEVDPAEGASCSFLVIARDDNRTLLIGPLGIIKFSHKDIYKWLKEEDIWTLL